MASNDGQTVVSGAELQDLHVEYVVTQREVLQIEPHIICDHEWGSGHADIATQG